MFFNDKLPNIIIFGDIMLDHNTYGKINKLANESPIPVLHQSNDTYLLGGCGNVLMNINSLKCNNIFLFSIIGNDYYGEKIINILNENNIKHTLIKNNKTTVKHRFYCDNKLLFRYDDEEYVNLSSNDERYIYNIFLNIIEKNKIDTIIFSDYNKGYLTETLCKKIIEKANEKGIFTCVDPKNNYEKYKYCSLIKPNRNEVKKLFNIEFNLEELENILSLIKEKVQCKNIVITLADKGISLLDEENNFYYNNTESIDVTDVTGAGDIVNSILSYYYPIVGNKEYIIKLCSYIATNSVKYTGTYIIKEEDIFKASLYFNDNKLITIKDLKYLDNNKIIFTNGCFDILHKGHLELFKYCKSLLKDGLLIVGLNSDTSIKKLKGELRPINNLESRIAMLNSIYYIDYIIIFEEDSPIEILKKIRPKILVKGGDYTYDTILGKEFCKEVKIFKTYKDFSTTNIIKKINDK